MGENLRKRERFFASLRMTDKMETEWINTLEAVPKLPNGHPERSEGSRPAQNPREFEILHFVQNDEWFVPRFWGSFWLLLRYNVVAFNSSTVADGHRNTVQLAGRRLRS